MKSSFILANSYRFGAWLATSMGGRNLVALALILMKSIFPEQKIAETETLVAFYHPKPVHRFHVLLMPKKPLASLVELADEQSLFLQEVIKTVKQIVLEYHLEGYGYRLICNGGAYQDFPYLHFHLISDLTDRGTGR